MPRWQITYAGITWLDEDITVAQAGAVAELAGDNWVSMNPWSGPRVLASWLIALLAPATGLEGAASFEAAASVVYALKLSTLLECITVPEAPSAGQPAMVPEVPIEPKPKGSRKPVSV